VNANDTYPRIIERDEQVVTVPVRCFLWQINLEHEGVDHAADLGMA
jgi:hypothetical protein